MKFKYFFLFIISSVSLFAQIDDFKLDAYFDVLEENDKFNGSVAVAQDGEIIYQRAIGFADYEAQRKNNPETLFRIGSISKTYTATMIMMAVEEGKINTEQTIADYFPTIKNADKITIDQLLSHRSGIKNFTSDPDYLNWNTHAKSEKEMIEIIAGYDSNFEPGTTFEYSNSNYLLLSFLLEKIYKKSFSEILNEKIIQPLHLKKTKFERKIKPTDNEAYSYQYNGEWVKSTETDMLIPMGAGGLSATPTDVILFGEALFNGKIVSPESLEKMKTLRDAYGYALFYFPFYEKEGLGHTGGIDNFSSSWVYFEEDKISVAITSNASDFNMNNLTIALLSAAFAKEFDLPIFEQSTGEVTPGYTGKFGNGQLGMKIEITETDGNYFAQASGQGAFPLEKISETEFRFDLAGIVIEFNPDLKSFILKQGGGEFIFVKE
ncbi:MAG: serine hydrolase domain-containing protein [Weeksellaceae bacterium]